MGSHMPERVDDARRIVVTGFEPFGSTFAEKNPSWLVASRLDNASFEYNAKKSGRTYRARVETRELPVDYAQVDAILPSMHKLNAVDPPLFYLHLGASNRRPWHFISLETRGHGTGYVKLDNRGFAPESGVATLYRGEGDPPDHVYLNNDFAQRLMARHPRGKKWQFSLSMDAGHYLCDYVLFNSTACAQQSSAWNRPPVPVVFAHVPPVGGAETPLSEEDLLEAIRFLVQTLFEFAIEDAEQERPNMILLEGNIGLQRPQVVLETAE